jgi:hypothetical protein
MVTSTPETASVSPTVILPSNFSKFPRTLLTIRWRARNPTWVWDGSRTYSPAASGGAVAV